MKKIIIIFILFAKIITNTYSQEIDSTNYYNYNVSGFGTVTDWLRTYDAIPVIFDEIVKSGVDYTHISVGDLIKLDNKKLLVLTVSFIKGDRLYGFIYEATHTAPLDPHERDFLKNEKEYGYVQYIFDVNPSSSNTSENWMSIPLPRKSIFLLKETCYWFQTLQDGSYGPVSKEFALKILRKDIQNYLKDL